jgi:hypothetical protein
MKGSQEAIMDACVNADENALVENIQCVPPNTYIPWGVYVMPSLVMETYSCCIDEIMWKISQVFGDDVANKYIMKALFAIQHTKGRCYKFYVKKLMSLIHNDPIEMLPWYDAYVQQTCELGDCCALHLLVPKMYHDVSQKWVLYCMQQQKLDMVMVLYN